MNREELKQALVFQGGKLTAVWFGDGNTEDRYCLIGEGRYWQVYYSERGSKVCPGSFATEEAACAYLWSLLERDATVWKSS
jgi:hypothetical protein